ncbi:MAG: hypothetical protein R3190_14965 [Thermoanaerobaculia bacterium]|nr:hypothetical protein [Thermoanaerobaculia bacterium]
MTTQDLLSTGFGVALVLFGSIVVLRRKVTMANRRVTSSGSNLGTRYLDLSGGPAILAGAAAVLAGATIVGPPLRAWLQGAEPVAASISGPTIVVLLFGGLAAAVWQHLRNARGILTSDDFRQQVSEKLEQAMAERSRSRPER